MAEVTQTKFGIGQLKNPSPTWAKTIANTAIIVCAIVGVIVAPMPAEWIPDTVKIYVLTITGSSGLLKVLEKFTGQSIEQN